MDIHTHNDEALSLEALELSCKETRFSRFPSAPLANIILCKHKLQLYDHAQDKNHAVHFYNGLI